MSNLEKLINDAKEYLSKNDGIGLKTPYYIVDHEQLSGIITQAYNQGKEDDVKVIQTLINTFKKVNDPKDIIVQIELLETVLSLIKKD